MEHILLCSASKWTTGDIWLAGDGNLAAGNIKKGVTIFGVTGTYEITETNVGNDGGFVFWKWADETKHYKVSYGFEGGYPIIWTYDAGMSGLASAWTQPFFITTKSFDFSVFKKIVVMTWGIRWSSISKNDKGADISVKLAITDGASTQMKQTFTIWSRKRGFGETNPGGGTWIGRTTTCNVTVSGVYKLTFYSMYWYGCSVLPYSVVLSKS